MNISGGAVGLGMLSRPASSPFTVSQWQELEHQSLIFKFLVAGVPVPPELVLPIQKSFQSLSARFFPNHSATYCSYYGKKVDPEPGRCRRTDGKKWRCSKDAHPDSKYCERHMHRGRNRSRKPVESQNSFQPSSTLTSPSMSEGNSVADSFQNLTFQAFGSVHDSCGSGNSSSQLKIDSNLYGITNKDYRYNNTESATHPPLLNYQPQQTFFTGGEVDTEEEEGQPLRCFFDKWP